MTALAQVAAGATLVAAIALGSPPDAAAQAAPKGAPLKTVVFIQPNPSAINSFQTAVATGEG
ncbi:MAG: hypothetical protein ABWZ78_14565, partial [Burkholderiaceae bacterium]